MKHAVFAFTCTAMLAGPAAFADSNGQAELSERRAQAAADAVASEGGSRTVNASSQAGSGTQGDREQNRRVEVVLNSRQVRALVSK